MATYIQMGHDSENLVGQPGLNDLAGIILSPVNRAPNQLARHLDEIRERSVPDVVFDPQLYFPRSTRGQLATHAYYPSDIDTADLNSLSWWREVVKKVVDEAERLRVNTVCSPIYLPKKYTNDYFSMAGDIYAVLQAELSRTVISPVMTLCVGLDELATPEDSLRIASIVTARNPKMVYVVIDAKVEPRRELSDAASLLALMVLIQSMEEAGCKTLVSHCSTEMLLLKCAGATHCASGKFFNLRRFTSGRFDDAKEGGGGQLPYWFEQNLIAFLRQADIARLQRDGFEDFVGGGFSNNAFGKEILRQFIAEPGKAWIALSWRQYLSWFIDTEAYLNRRGTTDVGVWLREAESRWTKLQDGQVLFQEVRNNGDWIRPWRQALRDFSRFTG